MMGKLEEGKESGKRYVGAQRLLCVCRGGGGGGFKGKRCMKRKQRPGPRVKIDYLSSLILSATANGLNGGPDISFLRAEREVVCHSVTYFWVPVQSPLTIHIPGNVNCWVTRLSLPQGILNHCFDDIENFMGKLQQTAEAATVLNQRKKKKKKSKKQSAEGKKRGGEEYVTQL